MRRTALFIVSAVLIACLSASAAPAGSQGSLAQRMEEAYLAKKPYPLASREIPDLTPEQAYAIQREFAALRTAKGETVIGYKAGLTAEPAQARFGMKEPVFGTLFTSMVRWPGTLRQKDFAKMFIETEIGFRFRKDILRPVKDPDELRDAVAIVFPAIELPDVAYADMKAVKGTDLIASNVAARKVLVGKAVPLRARDLNAVEVTLTLDGKEITKGVGKNALGDQWEALRWTVNNVLAMGGEIKEGYIVITGAISNMVPASPGAYRADYGRFGSIDFRYR